MNPTEVFAEFIAIEGITPRVQVVLDACKAAAEADLPAGDTEGLLRVLLTSETTDREFTFRQLQDWIWSAALAEIDWAELLDAVRRYEEARVEGLGG